MARILIFSDKNFRNHEKLNIKKDYKKLDNVICVSDLMDARDIFERRIYGQFDLFILDLKMGVVDNENRIFYFWLFDYIKHKPVYIYDDVKIKDSHYGSFELGYKEIYVPHDSIFLKHDRCDIFIPINKAATEKISVLFEHLKAKMNRNNSIQIGKAKLDAWIDIPYIDKSYPKTSEKAVYYSPRDRKFTISGYHEFHRNVNYEILLADKNIINPDGTLIFFRSPKFVSQDKTYNIFYQHLITESANYRKNVNIVYDTSRVELSSENSSAPQLPKIIIKDKRLYLLFNNQRLKLSLIDIHHPGRERNMIDDKLIDALVTLFSKGKNGIRYPNLIYTLFGITIQGTKVFRNKYYLKLSHFFLELRKAIKKHGFDPDKMLNVTRTDKLRLYCELIME